MNLLYLDSPLKETTELSMVVDKLISPGLWGPNGVVIIVCILKGVKQLLNKLCLSTNVNGIYFLSNI